MLRITRNWNPRQKFKATTHTLLAASRFKKGGETARSRASSLANGGTTQATKEKEESTDEEGFHSAEDGEVDSLAKGVSETKVE